MTEPQRVALIGCGSRSVDHLEAYKYLPRARPVACWSRSGEKAEKRAAEYGLRAYADCAEMLRQERPDLVHVITPPTHRVEPLSLCEELGVPAVTIEKPIAVGVSDWRELNGLAETGRTKVAVCHQVRWQEYLTRCRRALGGLGAVKFLDFSAGMNISGQGTHILNYARSLNDDARVKTVFGCAAGAAGMAEYHPAPDHTAGYLVFENGVRGLWNNGPTAPRCGDPATTWQHVRVAAYADRGRVLYEEFGQWEIVGPAGREGGDFGGMDGWRTNNRRAQAGFHEAVLDWLADDAREPGTSLRESLHEWKTVLALYASALERRPIELAGFEPDNDLFARLGGALAAGAKAV